MADLQAQLYSHRLTTARILYHMPDHFHLLQEYVWQDYDIAPKFPRLSKFLNFWTREIDGKLHSVYILRKDFITASECRFAGWEGTVH